MRRILAALAGLGILTLWAFPGEQRVVAVGPTASIGDWHLTVLDVERDTSTGVPHPVPADGVFYTVTVRIVGRGDFDARIVDAQGRAWPRAWDVEERLAGTARRLVFDVHDAISAPALELRRPGSRVVVEIPL